MGDTYVTCSVNPCNIVYQIDIPPFNLDVAGGLAIAGAIVGVWAFAWGFRVLLRLINGGGGGSSGAEGE